MRIASFMLLVTDCCIIMQQKRAYAKHLMRIIKQEDQVVLIRSPEFRLKLTYSNLLKADHVPGDTSGNPYLVPRALFEQTWKRSTR